MSNVAENLMMAKLTRTAARNRSRRSFERAYRTLEPAIRRIAVSVYYRRNSTTPKFSADLNDFADEAAWYVIQRFGKLPHPARLAIAPKWNKWVRGVLNQRLIDLHRQRSNGLRRLFDYWGGKMNDTAFRSKHGFDSLDKYSRWSGRLPVRPHMEVSDPSLEAAEEFGLYLDLIRHALLQMRSPVHALVILYEFDLVTWLGQSVADEIASRAGQTSEELRCVDRHGAEERLRISSANWDQVICRFKKKMRQGRMIAA